MAKTDPKNRRRKYFINKDFQTKFVVKFCVPIIITALLSAFMVYHFSGRSTTTVFENSRLSIKPTSEFIMPGLVLSSLISIILVGIATVIIMFFQSHKIAGPLHKLESSIERMSAGDLSFDISFRKGDAVKILSDVFNKSLKKLSGMVMHVKDEYAQLDSALADLKKRLPKDQAPEIGNEVRKLEQASARLSDKINKFKLR